MEKSPSIEHPPLINSFSFHVKIHLGVCPELKLNPHHITSKLSSVFCLAFAAKLVKNKMFSFEEKANKAEMQRKFIGNSAYVCISVCVFARNILTYLYIYDKSLQKESYCENPFHPEISG